MSFADDAARDLAMGRGKATVDEVLRRSEIARDGARAFHRWFDGLIRAFAEINGLVIGEPIVSRSRSGSPLMIAGHANSTSWASVDAGRVIGQRADTSSRA